MPFINWTTEFNRNVTRRVVTKFHTSPAVPFPASPYPQQKIYDSPFISTEPEPESHFIADLAEAEFAYANWQLVEGLEVDTRTDDREI